MTYESPTVDEARDALVRALQNAKRMGERFDFVVLYDRRQRWLFEAASIAVEKGWLLEGELIQLDEQSSEMRFRLTDAGRALAP